MSNSPFLPAHASPAFPPLASPKPSHSRNLSANFDLNHHHDHDNGAQDPPATLISPAFTPPATPGTGTPAIEREARSIPVDSATSTTPGPRLMGELPRVWCEVRARIPTTNGAEMYLYLYKNDADAKEHLAIVFGPHIRSKSLDAPRAGETEKDRMIRGAYVGRLHPGRTSSRVVQLRKEAAREGTVALKVGVSQEEIGTSTGGSSTSTTALAMQAMQSFEDDAEALSMKPPMVRIHSECYTGETVWSARCDCGEQLDEAARLMALPSNEAGGAIIYLRQEGRGIGLSEKLKAYNLQDLGHDTYEANLMLRHPADARSYGLATAMLMDLGLDGERGIRLLTNNPDKVRAVEGPHREVVVKERVAMVPLAWKTGGMHGIKSEEVEKYLSTKIEKFKHMIG